MASRGRGRGIGSFAFNKGLGFSKPEDSPPPSGQPPPTYPPLKFKPVPLVTGKKMQYLLSLKQEIRSSFKESGYYIPPVSVKKDIDRYTDKYQQIHAADQIVWDKSLFPKELFEQPGKKKRKIKKVVKKETVVEKLKVLESKEETEAKNEEEEEEEGEKENEEEYDEEELEEETDYAANYFDNGENYLDEEDDNLDEVEY